MDKRDCQTTILRYTAIFEIEKSDHLSCQLPFKAFSSDKTFTFEEEVHLREWFGAKETHHDLPSVAESGTRRPESIGISGRNGPEYASIFTT